VNVLTYHGAKGLEWPIVVLTELESELRDDPFGLFVEKAVESDWRDPLAGRWLRYWPWPYGAQEKSVGLDVTGPASAAGERVRRAEMAERTRLLYVGTTRARDYLVLATTGAARCWLDELKDDRGGCAVELRPSTMVACGVVHSARSATFDEGLDSIVPRPPRTLFGPRWPSETSLRAPLSLKPSAAETAVSAAVVEQVTIGSRISLWGDPDMQRVGEACHRFFAADADSLSETARLALAERVLGAWGVPNLAATDMVAAGERLRTFVAERFPGGVIRREWPVHAPAGAQLIDGRVDLLVEWQGQLVIVDHKAFPGVVKPEGDRLKAFVGQTELYSRALRAVHGPVSVQVWLHQPIAARLLRVEMVSQSDVVEPA
jgi:ATP-dependent exoDNAse (exonuclease V) beta subunit